MIQANELRCGNWVNTKHGIGVVASIHNQRPESLRIGVVVKPLLRYEYINPHVAGIQLHLGILGQAGFMFMEGRWYHPKLENCNIEYVGSHCQLISKGYLGVPFQYLHELQNIIYSLFKIELQITL